MEEDDKSPQKLTGGHECNPTDIDSDEHFSVESNNDSEKIRSFSSKCTDYTKNLNTADTSVNEGTQLCASGDMFFQSQIGFPQLRLRGTIKGVLASCLTNKKSRKMPLD
ncbi:hypothetical protein DVH24_019598 [Malus domestica]|uniref:Uncharacterized protein n=1 Tax=Malus domestica TaxID=3750 RepID=A0A498I0T7_MALDO|nr:hypothetical protein DVH24_019598 [Malus domestica]